jgi:hypothetical protein
LQQRCRRAASLGVPGAFPIPTDVGPTVTVPPRRPRRPLPRPRRAAPPGDAAFPSRRRPAPNGSGRTSSSTESGGPPPGGIRRVDPADLLPARSRVAALTSASFPGQRRARAAWSSEPRLHAATPPRPPAPSLLHGRRKHQASSTAGASASSTTAHQHLTDAEQLNGTSSTTGGIQGSGRREAELQPRSGGADQRRCGSARCGAPA